MGSLVKRLAVLAVVAMFAAVACTPPPGGEVLVVVVDGGATGVPVSSTEALIAVVEAIADGKSWTVEHRNRTSGSTDMTGVDVLWVPDANGLADLDRWVGLDVPTMWSHEKNEGWASPAVDEDYATGWWSEFTEFESYGQSTGHPVLTDLGWTTTLDGSGMPDSGLHTLMTQEFWHFSYLPAQLGSGAMPVLRFYPDATYTEATSFVTAAAYDDGAAMADGTTAQNRRVLFGLNRFSHDKISSEGDDFIAASLRWLANA
jgi:hypothetical protein